MCKVVQNETRDWERQVIERDKRLREGEIQIHDFPSLWVSDWLTDKVDPWDAYASKKPNPQKMEVKQPQLDQMVGDIYKEFHIFR